MKKQFILGLTGGIIGLVTAGYVLLISTSSDITLSGIQVALFSSLSLMGAAISRKEPQFAGWMYLSSSIWIIISAPISRSFFPVYLYIPTVIILGISAVLCFWDKTPEMSGENP
jgi:hypothetical protein